MFMLLHMVPLQSLTISHGVGHQQFCVITLGFRRYDAKYITQLWRKVKCHKTFWQWLHIWKSSGPQTEKLYHVFNGSLKKWKVFWHIIWTIWFHYHSVPEFISNCWTINDAVYGITVNFDHWNRGKILNSFMAEGKTGAAMASSLKTVQGPKLCSCTEFHVLMKKWLNHPSFIA